MLEKRTQFNFSKQNDQRKFEKLNEDKKSKILKQAHEEAIVENEKKDLEKEILSKDIANLIVLSRIKIISEDEDSFIVKIEDDEIKILKSNETYFDSSKKSFSSETMGLEMRQEHSFDSSIFQDKNVPRKFVEVMIFHEIREMDYSDSGFEDAHIRALNDEILYILKYFNRDDAIAYFEFSKKTREKLEKNIIQEKKKEEKRQKEKREAEEKRKEEKEIKDKIIKKEKEEIKILRTEALKDLGIQDLDMQKKSLNLEINKGQIFEFTFIREHYIKKFVRGEMEELSLFPVSEKIKELFYKNYGNSLIYQVFIKLAEEINSLCSGEISKKEFESQMEIKVKTNREVAKKLLAKIEIFSELSE